MVKKICPECGSKKQQLHPNVEEYIDNIFCFKIPFINYKLMLFYEQIELQCERCAIEMEKTSQDNRNRDGAIYYQEKADEYDKIMEEGYREY